LLRLVHSRDGLMQIKFRCKCNKVFATSAENAGKRAKCSNCGTMLLIPNAASPPPRSIGGAVAPNQDSALASDGLNLGPSDHPLWSDEDLLSTKAPVIDEERNPYRASTTLSSSVDRSSPGRQSGMSFVRSLYSFTGRIPRSTFWAFQGAFFLVFVALGALMRAGSEAQILVVVIFWILIGPMIAFQVKRWHDLDKSGLFILINFVPFVGGLISLVVLGAVSGTRGANSYGPDPLRKAR
jgi:uncharacterized membrane protein YhaH (DUF805 family)